MRGFLIFAIVCCVVSGTEDEDIVNPAILTGTTQILRTLCGSSLYTSVSAACFGQAVDVGLKKYQETNDVALATTEASKAALKSGQDMLKSFGKTAKSGIDTLHEIQGGGNAKEILSERTTEVYNYFKKEVMENPKGEAAKSLLTGGNIALTLTMGPLAGWGVATVAVLTIDAIHKYQETGDMNEAKNYAAKCAIESNKSLAKTLCTLLSKAFGLAKNAAIFAKIISPTS